MKKKVMVYFLTSIIVFSSIVSSFLVSVPVLALSAGGLQSTIASIIISLLLQTGTAPTNQVWLDSLNYSYGVESSIGTIADCIESGLLTESATGLLDTGLSDAIAAQPAYTELGLSDIFTTTIDDAGVIAGSGALNLTNSAINVGTLGTIGAYAGAVGIGVGLGVLINHAREAFQNFIRAGVKINLDNNRINSVPEGYFPVISSYGRVSANYYNVFYLTVKDTSEVCAYASSPYQYNLVGVSSNGQPDRVPYENINSSNNQVQQTGTQVIYASPGQLAYIDGSVGNWGTPYTNVKVFPDLQSCNNYLNQYKADPSIRTYPISPDLIGKDGNHRAVNDNGEVTYPGFVAMVPEGYDMEPVDMDDYQQYVDDANQNTEDGDTDETQATMFENFVNQYLVPDLSQDPDQPVEPEQPVVPDNPSVPDRPLIPDQPETPSKPVVDAADQADALQGVTDIDLRAVFPFCIPFDLYAALSNLKYEGREAPVIVFTFPDTRFTSSDWGIIIDFSEYDEVAEILRKLELLLFIIGLAVETRKLIGAS